MRLGWTLRGKPLVALAAAALWAAPAAAFADDSDAKVRAKQLFEEGMRAIDRRDRVTGCAKLRESLAMFAVPNTLFNVAECDERDGKFASAFDHWQRGVTLVDVNDARVRVAKKRLEALDGRIARLRIVAAPSIGSATVMLDGVEVDRATLSEPIVVDPGKHVVVTRVAGHEDYEREVNLAARDRTEVVVRAGAVKKNADQSSRAVKLRTGGAVALGIGVAGAIAAGVTGGLLLSRDKQIADRCNGSVCDRTGYDLAQGQGPLLVGNAVAWGIGAAGVGTSVMLMILSKRAEKTESHAVVPLVAPNLGGLGVMGRF